MAKIQNKTIDVPYSGETLNCPVCFGNIEVTCSVQITEGSVSKKKEKSFGESHFSINFSTELSGVRIFHECGNTTGRPWKKL